MDTLTWQLETGQLTLTLRSREALTAGIRETDLEGRDALGRGRLLTNAAGMTFALLTESASCSSTKQANKGDLLSSLTTTADLRQVSSCLQHMDLYGYSPFTLLVFQGLRPPVLWHWNGRALRQIIAPPSPLHTPAQGSALPGTSALRRLTGWQRPATALTLQVTRKRANLTQQDSEAPAQHDIPLTLSEPEALQGGEAPDFRPGPIDVCALFNEKNPSLYRRLPAFAPPLLRWVAREKVMNKGLWELRDVPGFQFPDRVLNHLGVRASLHPGSATLPEPGERPVFVANHPTGGYDGVLLLAWLLQFYPRLRVVVTDALLSVPHLRPFLVPVDRYRQARSSTVNVKEAFASDDALLIFPAGRTGRTQGGRIVDAPWQKMPITLARQFERPLVPLHIEGHHSRLFNGVAAVRKRLGIELNLEMLLLARDFVSPPCRHFVLAAAKPVSVHELEQMGARDDERLKVLRDQYEYFAEHLRCQLHPPTAAITGEVPV